MLAKVVKAYKPQKEANLSQFRFTKIVFNNEESDIYILKYIEENKTIEFLSDITTKLKEGDIFFIGEKKDKDFKMEVIKSTK